MSTTKYFSFFSHAGRIAKVVGYLIYISAVLCLLNSFCSTIHSWENWHYVFNANTALLFIINIGLLLVSWLNFAARGNKLAGCIDDAYGTTLAQEPAAPMYYDNSNVLNADLRFALNVYESCYFSDVLLAKQTFRIVVKNILIMILFFIAVVLEKSHVIMTILGLFVVIYSLRRLVALIVVRASLSTISSAFQSLFNMYKKTGFLDIQSVILQMSNYETAMVWNGTVISGRVYKKYNVELTKAWLAKQQGFLRINDTNKL